MFRSENNQHESPRSRYLKLSNMWSYAWQKALCYRIEFKKQTQCAQILLIHADSLLTVSTSDWVVPEEGFREHVLLIPCQMDQRPDIQWPIMSHHSTLW
jgi:hypothetical protein